MDTGLLTWSSVDCNTAVHVPLLTAVIRLQRPRGWAASIGDWILTMTRNLPIKMAGCPCWIPRSQIPESPVTPLGLKTRWEASTQSPLSAPGPLTIAFSTYFLIL